MQWVSAPHYDCKGTQPNARWMLLCIQFQYTINSSITDPLPITIIRTVHSSKDLIEFWGVRVYPVSSLLFPPNQYLNQDCTKEGSPSVPIIFVHNDTSLWNTNDEHAALTVQCVPCIKDKRGWKQALMIHSKCSRHTNPCICLEGVEINSMYGNVCVLLSIF